MLMLVDHWNDEDKQMIFESSYQLLLLVNFFIKLFCEYWNHDMVNTMCRGNVRVARICFKLRLYRSINWLLELICQICRLYEAIEYHWNVLTNKIEIQILRYYSDISRKLTIFYSSEYVVKKGLYV